MRLGMGIFKERIAVATTLVIFGAICLTGTARAGQESEAGTDALPQPPMEACDTCSTTLADCDGCASYREVTVMRPQYVTETRMVPRTTYKRETRERMRTV